MSDLSSDRKSLWDHPCIARTSALLEKERNTRLVIAQTFNFKTEEEGERLLIATEKVDPKKKGKAIPIFATFCPFCGEKL